SCRFGRIVRNEKAGLLVAEILLDRPLARGETTVIEYVLNFPGPPYKRGDDSYCRKFNTPVREYVAEFFFDPRALPSYVEQYTTDLDDQVTSRRKVTVEPDGRCHIVGLDFGPGTFCVHWDWDR